MNDRIEQQRRVFAPLACGSRVTGAPSLLSLSSTSTPQQPARLIAHNI